MSASESDWSDWVERLRSGDPDVIHQFWESYGVRLVRLAERNLVARIRRRLDPEDVVQSAFRTFLRRVQQDEFELADREGLWSLLSAITLNKARMAVRRHSRDKRSVGREVYLDKLPGSRLGDKLTLPDPSPDDATALVDLVEKLAAELDGDERGVFLLKLEECGNDEIAARLGCSERTVRRINSRLRDKLELLLDEQSDGAS